MRMINLIAHDIDLVLPDGRQVTFPPSGKVARVTAVNRLDVAIKVDDPSCGEILIDPEEITIPTVEATSYGEVVDLPDPAPGIGYIVSGLVASALAGTGRTDVFAPDTGPTAIRYKEGPSKGQIEAVCRFIRVAK